MKRFLWIILLGPPLSIGVAGMAVVWPFVALIHWLGNDDMGEFMEVSRELAHAAGLCIIGGPMRSVR